MATASAQQRSITLPADTPAPATSSDRASEQLKEVPEPKAMRERIRAAAIELAARLDKSRPLARHEMEAHARSVLDSLGVAEAYLGWTMVALASAFWHDQVAAIPYNRRLLLLPRCLRDEEVCQGQMNEVGLVCESCGACSLSSLRTEAEQRGYRVLIAEGSPAVMKIILGGHADALLGIACLDVLEKTLDKILLSGIPCMAVPLLGSGCHNTSADDDWIRRMIDTPHRPARLQTRTYLNLMRCAARMFEPDELERLAPRARAAHRLAEADGDGLDAFEPIACTEAIAYDFLAAGGKHARPFITLAVYDALTGDRGTAVDAAGHVANIPDAVKRIALAIEVFHKASLVHDDIEDDDALRYGKLALHQKYGVPTAINVGDYLIGLGYRLVAGQRETLPSGAACDILAQFASAHTKLCEGQGAELVWRDARDKRLAPRDALAIYALKTAPAFEAALLAGIRLAGPVDPYRDVVAKFSRHFGVAYQILNDLDDWQDPEPESRRRGGDLLGGRPTMLWALAMQRLEERQRRELQSLLGVSKHDKDKIARADALYRQADAYQQAASLVAKHHARARAVADRLDNEPLHRLLYFLADAILDRRPLSVSDGRGL